MLTPFNGRDDWEMGVQRVGDTGCIHLLVRDTAFKVQERRPAHSAVLVAPSR